MRQWIAVVMALVATLACRPGRGRTEPEAIPLRPPAPAACVPDLRNMHGLFQQPGGPFAVMVFDEDALGVHVGVIYYQPMTNPKDGAWGITDRFWQETRWGSDVTSFAWGPDGDTLFVATGEVYGEACVFRLHLRERRAERFYPPAGDASPPTSVSIVAMDAGRKVLTLGFPDSEDPAKTVKVPFN